MSQLVRNDPFLTSSEGKFYEFFVTFALVINPLTVKNRPCALIRSCALNQKNTVCQTLTHKSYMKPLFGHPVSKWLQEIS